MILVRSGDSGLVFLIREAEEVISIESLVTSYPGRRVEILQRNEGLLLVHVVPEGCEGPADDLAIGRVDLPPPKS